MLPMIKAHNLLREIRPPWGVARSPVWAVMPLAILSTDMLHCSIAGAGAYSTGCPTRQSGGRSRNAALPCRADGISVGFDETQPGPAVDAANLRSAQANQPKIILPRSPR